MSEEARVISEPGDEPPDQILEWLDEELESSEALRVSDGTPSGTWYFWREATWKYKQSGWDTERDAVEERARQIITTQRELKAIDGQWIRRL